MAITYHLEGLAELQAKLEALPVKLAKRVLRPALLDAGAIVQQEAGVLAPRKSGNLTTNIEVEVIVHNDLSAEVHIGPDEAAWYAKFSELGTAPHEESSPRGTKPFMHPGEPPRPWLRPAFANTADAQLEALVNNIKDGLEDVVGK